MLLWFSLARCQSTKYIVEDYRHEDKIVEEAVQVQDCRLRRYEKVRGRPGEGSRIQGVTGGIVLLKDVEWCTQLDSMAAVEAAVR